MNFSVSELTPAESSEWDAFVERAPDGLPMHLSAWQEVITDTYHHPCHFLLARQGGEICGVLPLFRVKSLLTGDCLQSPPGALCAASPEAADALISSADDLACQLGVDALILRDSRQAWPGLESVQAHRGVIFPFLEDPAQVWKNLEHDIRRHIRRGQEDTPLQIEISKQGLRDFYLPFSEIISRFGTPPFGFNFIRNLTHQLPDHYLIVCAYANGNNGKGRRPIGGIFCLIFKKQVYAIWGASLHAFRNMHSTHQIYWALIEHGCRAKYTSLDMGRSLFPSNQYHFKTQWSQQSYPVYQLYRLFKKQMNTGQLLPALGDNGTGGSHNRFKQIWKHLPMPVARFLGPILRWHIPFG